MMNAKTCFLTVLLLACSLLGNSFEANADIPEPESEEKALVTILAKWQEAWNKGDREALLSLHHPESRWRIAFEADETKRKEFVEEFGKIIVMFGKIESSKVGKYIDRKKRYVVKIDYEKKGVVPGTFALKKTTEGEYLIDDFNIDGQGEPELEE